MTTAEETAPSGGDAPPARGGVGRPGGSGGHSYAKTSLVGESGQVFRFSGTIFRNLSGAIHYPSEIFRQLGILILSTSPPMLFLLLMLASEASLEGHYLLKQLGVNSYVGLFTAYAQYKVGPIFWGWMLSAKVGTGLVAELGSMRINDEIDALEVMGINSIAYLLSTRIIAILIFTPFTYTIGMALMALDSYLLNVFAFGGVSQGGYLQVFWQFMSQYNFEMSCLNTFVLSIIIILVGCFYGFTASGGPVGVGTATAKSMIINMVVVSVVGAVFMQLFFGGGGRLPISY
jgi:phospholipid/cholesterol/gamma-HCH transport system permease protein